MEKWAVRARESSTTLTGKVASWVGGEKGRTGGRSILCTRHEINVYAFPKCHHGCRGPVAVAKLALRHRKWLQSLIARAVASRRDEVLELGALLRQPRRSRLE